MSILRQIAVLIAQICLCAVCFAQREKIDSLKKVLLTAKDTTRINCLNTLGKIYQEIQTDTALFYSHQVLSETRSLNYRKGAAEAFLVIGNVYLIRGDYKSAEQNFRLCIYNYKNELNEDALGWAYFGLGASFSVQSSFQSATQAYLEADKLFKKVKDPQGSAQTLFFLAYIITKKVGSTKKRLNSASRV
jgi:tetratricopeptide (TPR) repeat protein